MDTPTFRTGATASQAAYASQGIVPQRAAASSANSLSNAVLSGKDSVLFSPAAKELSRLMARARQENAGLPHESAPVPGNRMVPDAGAVRNVPAGQPSEALESVPGVEGNQTSERAATGRAAPPQQVFDSRAPGVQSAGGRPRAMVAGRLSLRV